MRTFTNQVLNQLDDLYSMKFESNYKELIMAIFMQIFSYHYDDRNSDEFKFNNIEDITKKVWVSGGIPNKTNEDVGVPKLLTESAKKLFYDYDINGKTRYILNKIRSSIVHGDFFINEDGTITINDKHFSMVFEFDCIVDICNILYNLYFAKVGVLQELFDFKNFISNIKQYDLDYINKGLMSYDILRYVIVLFNVLPMNEDNIHNDISYINHILTFFPKRKYFENNQLVDEKDVEQKDLSKLRNCITHGEYLLDGEVFILYDVFIKKNKEKNDIRFEFDFKELTAKKKFS